MLENLVLLGTTLGLGLLVCSLIKKKANCTKWASVLLLLTAVALYPFLKNSHSVYSSYINYQLPRILLVAGSIFSILTLINWQKVKHLTFMLSILSILSVLTAFNLIGFVSERISLDEMTFKRYAHHLSDKS